MTSISKLLFLCTGNYYRSRFAELLFNERAMRVQLPWQAESRGLALELGVHNRGPISPAALQGLQARGVQLEPELRFPQQVCADDFVRADRIIALYEAEHRPLLLHRFPAWSECVEYWQAPDVHEAPVAAALATIDAQVEQLISTLSKNESNTGR